MKRITVIVRKSPLDTSNSPSVQRRIWNQNIEGYFTGYVLCRVNVRLRFIRFARNASTNKVERLITEYGLEGIGDELERRWTGQNDERDSLRTLADVFNRRLLTRAMADRGMDAIDGEVENYYRLLTNDDISQGTKTETVMRLRQQGIDVEALETDFVTYQAIRTYLQDIRGASYSSENTTPTVESVRASFDRLIGRTTAVVEQKLQQFRSSEQLTLGSFQIRTSVVVYCEDCETQYDVTALLDRGGCDCDRSSSD